MDRDRVESSVHIRCIIVLNKIDLIKARLICSIPSMVIMTWTSKVRLLDQLLHLESDVRATKVLMTDLFAKASTSFFAGSAVMVQSDQQELLEFDTLNSHVVVPWSQISFEKPSTELYLSLVYFINVQCDTCNSAYLASQTGLPVQTFGDEDELSWTNFLDHIFVYYV